MARIMIFACAAVLALSSPALAQRWGHERTPRDGACFYRDADFRGEYFCVDAGRSVAELSRDMNDEISSVRIFGRAEVYVYRDRRLTGRSTRLDHDVHNLKNEGWNDTISSMEVRSPRGGGYGGGDNYNRPSSRDVERIITRAYQDLLDRNPDQEGMRVYRSHMIDDGWPEAKVRDSIRDSAEYRDLHTMTYPKAQEVVRKAYVNVLKREPDPASSVYVNKVLREHWTQADVERELRKSPEYRNRGR
jgi:Peptidase inhibitor family I36